MSVRRRVWAAALLVMVAGCDLQEPGALAPRGTEAAELGSLTLLLVVLGGAVFILVMVVFGLAIRPGRSRGPEEGEEARSRRLVIGGGVVLPVVVLVPLTLVMLVVGAGISDRHGDAAVEIEVIGHQFWWEVRYPDYGVVTANEIHIPAGTPVRMTLASADVIHSVWVPQLAGKIDMIPGKLTELRIDADEPGIYRGFCAEFCGLQHGRMHFFVIAQEPAEFEAWAARQAQPAAEPADDAARRGAEVFSRYGCGACHTVGGTDADGVLGPDLTHLASRRTIGAGVLANGRGQLSGWVADPQGVKPGNLMPPTPLAGPELNDLVTYLEGLE